MADVWFLKIPKIINDFFIREDIDIKLDNNSDSDYTKLSCWTQLMKKVTHMEWQQSWKMKFLDKIGITPKVIMRWK